MSGPCKELTHLSYVHVLIRKTYGISEYLPGLALAIVVVVLIEPWTPSIIMCLPEQAVVADRQLS